MPPNTTATVRAGGASPALAAAHLEREINPAVVAARLRSADVSAIADVFAEARALGQRAWMATAVCVGIAQERAGRGDRVLEQLAKLFRLHRSRIARLGRIYRELIAPRIDEQGEAATFVLTEQAWYEIAVEAAPVLERPASELLAEAEDAKLIDPRYSTRRWKEELGIADGSTGDGARKLRALLVRLAGIEDDVIEQFRHSGECSLLERAADVLERARAGEDAAAERAMEYALCDPAGVVLDVTPGLAARLGTTREAMLGQDGLRWAADPDTTREAMRRIATDSPVGLDAALHAVNEQTGEVVPVVGALEITGCYSLSGVFKGFFVHDPLPWRGTKNKVSPPREVKH